MDRKALSRMLRLMQAEASRLHAPVLRVDAATAGDPFRILVFTMLSARTRDETTLKAVTRLFRQAKTPAQVVSLGPEKLEKILYGVGFYRVKTKNLLATCRMLVTNGGRMPGTPKGLLALPGVGRKTANIVLARAFNKPVIGVDVHVHRISNLMGLVKTKKPEQTEKELMRLVPRRHVRDFNTVLVAFGQTHSLKSLPSDIARIKKLAME